jgi:KDO2-lipid IV(A) lauroyltransferase
MVAIAGDKAVAGKRVEVEFFGRAALLPRGPASLARRSGATVLVACGVRAGYGYRGIVSGPVPIQRTQDAESDDRENSRRLAAIFEDIIRRHPDQWLMFDNLWSGATNSAVTIMQTEEATV